MELETKHFGILKYTAEFVYDFDEGLPGFGDLKKFILISDGEPNGLFYWLQSMEDGEVAFALMDVYQVKPDYNPLVEPELLQDLGDFSDNTLNIYNVCVVPDEIAQMRVHLKAPVVINMQTRKGKQVICNNEEYGIRHLIFEEMEEWKHKEARAE